MLESDFAHARHDAHVQHHVDAIRELHPDLTECGTFRPHEKRNDIHRSAAHCAVKNLGEPVVRLSRRHPVVVGPGFLLPLRCRRKLDFPYGQHR